MTSEVTYLRTLSIDEAPRRHSVALEGPQWNCTTAWGREAYLGDERILGGSAFVEQSAGFPVDSRPPLRYASN